MDRRDFVKAIVALPVTASAAAALGQIEIVPNDGQVHSPKAPGTTPIVPPKPPIAPPVVEHPRFNFRAQRIPSTVADQVASTEAHFFNEQEMATLRKLGDILIPPLEDRPGATEAGAAEFIDFLIGASPQDRRDLYRSGLKRLNADAHRQFKIPFAQVDQEQAGKLIRPWLRTWIRDHPPREPFVQFINEAHEELRTATQNSYAWTIAATSSGERAPGGGLYWSPIDPDIRMYV